MVMCCYVLWQSGGIHALVNLAHGSSDGGGSTPIFITTRIGHIGRRLPAFGGFLTPEAVVVRSLLICLEAGEVAEPVVYLAII